MRHLKAVVALLSATVLSQLLALLCLPLLTRLLSPAELGLLSVLLSTVALLAPWLLLNLPQALVVTPQAARRHYIEALSLHTLMLTCLAAVLLILVLVTTDLLGLSFSIVLLVPLLWFTGISQLAQQQQLAKKNFYALARVELRHSILLNAGKVVMALLLPLSQVLMLVTLLARWFYIRQLGALHADDPLWSLQKLATVKKAVDLRHRAAQLWRGWRRYRDFTLYQTGQQGLNVLSQHSPLLLLSLYQGPAVAAIYMLAKTVLEAPASLVNKAVADVFYPYVASRQQHAQPLLALYCKVMAALVAVACIPFTLIFCFGPQLFQWLFGSQWADAGEIAGWMSLWFLLVFCNAPAGRVIVVCRLQRLALWLNVVTTVLRLGGLVIALNQAATLLDAVLWLVFIGVLHNVAYILLAGTGAWQHDRTITDKYN